MSLFRLVELVSEPSQNAVRVPFYKFGAVKPDCATETVSGLLSTSTKLELTVLTVPVVRVERDDLQIGARVDARKAAAQFRERFRGFVAYGSIPAVRRHSVQPVH